MDRRNRLRIQANLLAIVTLAVIFALSFFATPVDAAPTGQEDSPHWIWLGGGLLNDITCVDQSTCWAVGHHGLILHTSDGGRTWEIQPSHSSAYLHRVQFLDEQHGWAVGVARWVEGVSLRGGYVIRTTDGGKQWEVMDRPDEPALFMNQVLDVCFADPQNGWVVGTSADPYGSLVISQTSDGGATWSKTLFSSVVSSAAGLDCSIPGRLWVSTQEGILFSWTEETGWVEHVLSDAPDFLVDIVFADPQRGWATDKGRVWRTMDGGETWTAVPTLPDLLGQRLVWTANRLWLAGTTADDEPRVMVSDDEGSTWQLEEIPVGRMISQLEVPRIGLTILPNEEGWLVFGFGALAQRSATGGWSLQREGFDLTFGAFTGAWETLATIGPRGVIVGGESPSLWYSSSFGQPWQRISTEGLGGNVTQIQFINGQLGWAMSGYYSTLWRTTDGGKSWSRLRTWDGPAKVHFATSEHGWAVENASAKVFLWTTADGGESWVRRATFPNLQSRSVFGLDEQRAWITGIAFMEDTLEYVPVIFYTADGGSQWQPASLPEELTQPGRQAEIGNLAFHNEKYGWAAGTHPLYTVDGGRSWALLPECSWVAFDVATRAPSEIWFAGSNGSLCRSVDGGQTWDDYSASLPAHELYALVLPADGSVVVAGEDGLIFGLPPTAVWKAHYLPLILRSLR